MNTFNYEPDQCEYCRTMARQLYKTPLGFFCCASHEQKYKKYKLKQEVKVEECNYPNCGSLVERYEGEPCYCAEQKRFEETHKCQKCGGGPLGHGAGFNMPDGWYCSLSCIPPKQVENKIVLERYAPPDTPQKTLNLSHLYKHMIDLKRAAEDINKILTDNGYYAGPQG